MAKTEIRVGGLGGQGVILNASILGKAASIFEGKHATLIQAFGPEARGSACSAQVTISTEDIGYPYVKHPDVLVLMSQDAYNQFAPTLKPGGLLLYEEELVSIDNRLPKGWYQDLWLPAKIVLSIPDSIYEAFFEQRMRALQAPQDVAAHAEPIAALTSGGQAKAEWTPERMRTGLGPSGSGTPWSPGNSGRTWVRTRPQRGC